MERAALGRDPSHGGTPHGRSCHDAFADMMGFFMMTRVQTPPRQQNQQPRLPLTPRGDWPEIAVRVGWALVAAAIILRLVRFLEYHSLWLDEVYLADNILGRGFWQLTHKLDNGQGSPIGFLWVSWIFTRMFGSSEYVLRLPSLLAGAATLPLFFLLLRRSVNARTGLIALVLIGICQSLVR